MNWHADNDALDGSGAARCNNDMQRVALRHRCD